MTIAGSDSGGGAGIQADLKTFARYGVFGTSVITAVTAQNTVRVRAWEAVTPELVRAQLDALVEDLRPVALKSGMLGSAEITITVAECIGRNTLAPYVLDPVMVATSGDVLIRSDAVEVLCSRLVPLAALVTPNLDEAAIMVGRPMRSAVDMEYAARRLVDEMGAGAALVKGGHLAGAELVDVLYDGSRLDRFVQQRIETRAGHGTGCTLSSAIVASLALGATLNDAVASGRAFVRRALSTAPGLGSGRGPLNHFA
jgi:hydroxymethylpyrimidine/phosphomethylpyrimidine kinase